MENCRIVLPYRVRTVLQEQGKCVTYSISQVRRGVGIGCCRQPLLETYVSSLALLKTLLSGCSSLGFVAKAVQ